MAKRVIALLGEPIYDEDTAAAEAITPGHLVDFNGSGLLIKHAGAALNAAPWFALERDEMGKDIDAAYAIGDTVKTGHFAPGMRVNALLAPAAAAVAKGAFVESAGNGTVRILTANAATAQSARRSVVGKALEAVDNSAGGTAARLRIIVV